MDGGAWQATVHGVAKSRTRLSDFTFTCSTSKASSTQNFFKNPAKTMAYDQIFLGFLDMRMLQPDPEMEDGVKPLEAAAKSVLQHQASTVVQQIFPTVDTINVKITMCLSAIILYIFQVTSYLKNKLE